MATDSERPSRTSWRRAAARVALAHIVERDKRSRRRCGRAHAPAPLRKKPVTSAGISSSGGQAPTGAPVWSAAPGRQGRRTAAPAARPGGRCAPRRARRRRRRIATTRSMNGAAASTISGGARGSAAERLADEHARKGLLGGAPSATSARAFATRRFAVGAASGHRDARSARRAGTPPRLRRGRARASTRSGCRPCPSPARRRAISGSRSPRRSRTSRTPPPPPRAAERGCSPFARSLPVQSSRRHHYG